MDCKRCLLVTALIGLFFIIGEANTQSSPRDDEAVEGLRATQSEFVTHPAQQPGDGQDACGVESLTYTVVMTLTKPAPDIEGLTFDGEGLWVADPEHDQLHKIDISDGDLVRTLPAPCADGNNLWGGPDGLAWDGTSLWVMCDPNNQSHRIYKIDPENGDVLASFPSPGPQSDGLTYDGTYLYLFDNGTNVIYVIEPASGSVVDSFTVPGSRLEDLAWDGSYLWYADNLALRIYKHDLVSRQVVDSFDFPTSGGLTWVVKDLWTARAESLVALRVPACANEVPLLKQCDPRWKDDPYDHSTPRHAGQDALSRRLP